MAMIRLQSHAEQMAEHLRQELRLGRWRGWMPGVLRLEKELAVNRNTLEAALRILEGEGVLVPQGAGKRRRIEVPKNGGRRHMRVGILTLNAQDQRQGYLIELNHQLQRAEYISFFATKSMEELGMDVSRVARMVQEAKADIWVVVAGPRDVLKWFETSGFPTFAMFGRRTRMKLAGAGPDKVPSMLRMVRRLVELGHRRIVLLNHQLRRVPVPGHQERAFLKELHSLGVPTGPYNMPDWEVSADGFHQCLEGLFRYTPPTALIADEVPYFLAAMQYCGNHGLRVPQQVSLVCMDANPAFTLFQPQVAHIRWDPQPVITRVLRWAQDVTADRDQRKQYFTKAEFVEGGTMGPAPHL